MKLEEMTPAWASSGFGAYMESKLLRALTFGLIGSEIGLSTGVAALGGAVNGAVIFGPIGFFVGWLLPLRSSPNEPARADEEIEPPQEAGTKASNFQHVEKSINDLMPVVGRMLAAIWNMQMKLLIAVGVMSIMQKYPWAMLGLGFILLAALFPLGVIFSITGAAAIHFNASAEEQFLVDLDSLQA